ncbi:MAG: SH3 domain-containing protein, partial [Chloroflexota bacterium]|nr:SH3 domain-containing protein [Chloroflexota bacterium]
TETTAAAVVAETDSEGTDTDSAFVAGAMVLTSDEVNLRAAPSLDAAIIAILGPGIELEVTGGATDGWVPVLEVGTGRRGFVTDAFLTAQ